MKKSVTQRGADQTTLTFSLPKSLKAEIQKRAEIEERPVANYLVHYLNAHFQAEHQSQVRLIAEHPSPYGQNQDQ